MKQITRMDGVVGLDVQYLVYDLRKCVVEVRFSLVDAIFTYNIKVIESKMGIGEVDEFHVYAILYLK